mgnify:CR=1 FL=1
MDKGPCPRPAIRVLFAVGLIVIGCVALLWCVLSALSSMLH